MAKTISDFMNEADEQTRAQRDKALKSAEDSANLSIKQTTNEYNHATDQAKASYESEYERNAVQKLINEKSIAEKNANLGLTDSGLNRTQQTAAQLSYANQKGDIDLARQNSIDTLKLNLASAISNIKKELEANKLDINQTYDQMNMQLATELQNADIAKQQYNSYSYGYSSGGSGGYEVDTAYYQGAKNADAAKYGTFSNGYQPKGISGHGILSKSGETMQLSTQTLSGQKQKLIQNVWKAEDGTKWYWEGRQNKYIQIK